MQVRRAMTVAEETQMQELHGKGGTASQATALEHLGPAHDGRCGGGTDCKFGCLEGAGYIGCDRYEALGKALAKLKPSRCPGKDQRIGGHRVLM